MDINKALKKQKKSYRNFVLFMLTLFFLLPLFLFIYKRYNTFFIAYLLAIEIMIVAAIIMKISTEKLYFKCDGYKLNIKQGIFKEKYCIICDKVFLVCLEGKEKFDIILITDSRFRTNSIRRVSREFIHEHNYLSDSYERLREQYPEKDFYYIIIKNGMYEKYQLLDLIYSNCVRAFYTENSIEKIKEYRNQIKKE